jgi:methyltransferase (TIGR00027 family)
MRRGQASVTARRVAAQRLLLPRLPADPDDPDGDDRLSRDVAGSLPVTTESPMFRYLAARTEFFDRVVVGALQQGVTQVVIAAAGYDGRALRYARPGVHWYEVDHPATQRDKIDRLSRLGLSAPQISFVAADFTVDDVGAGLAAAGHRAETPTLFLCEGIAVYLERDVIERLLRSLRSRAAAGSRLAISLSVTGASAERRLRFQTGVAALGEPVRTVLTAETAEGLLAATGWRGAEDPPVDPGHQRARRAGCVIALPVPVTGQPPTTA